MTKLSRLFFIIKIFLLLLDFGYFSFQDKLFRKILENNKTENILISPFSIYQILSLLSNGATAETQKEIFQTIYPNKEINKNLLNDLNSNINETISNIILENSIKTSCHSKDKDKCRIHFNNINGIFYKKGIKLNEEFTKICHNYITLYYEMVDANQINKFYKEHTNGKIDNIFDEIDQKTLSILINLISFKGVWYEKFRELNNDKQNFTNSDKTKVIVDTMYQKYKEQLYYEDEKIQIISLPYISNHLKFEMIIILPNLTKYSSPIDYLNKETITFNELYSKMKLKKNIHLYLPKFNANFQIDLLETLQKLGIKSLISKNFNNIYSNQNLLFDKLLQQTYFDIN